MPTRTPQHSVTISEESSQPRRSTRPRPDIASCWPGARRSGQVTSAGIEGTGSHRAGLCRHLHDAGISVIEVNRINRQHRRRRGKSDPADAEAAARAVLAGDATAIPKHTLGNVEASRHRPAVGPCRRPLEHVAIRRSVTACRRLRAPSDLPRRPALRPPRRVGERSRSAGKRSPSSRHLFGPSTRIAGSCGSSSSSSSSITRRW